METQTKIGLIADHSAVRSLKHGSEIIDVFANQNCNITIKFIDFEGDERMIFIEPSDAETICQWIRDSAEECAEVE